MQWNPKGFEQYCCTKVYHDDYAMAFAKPSVPYKLMNRARSSRSAIIIPKKNIIWLTQRHFMVSIKAKA
jgi:hypothetical protein